MALYSLLKKYYYLKSSPLRSIDKTSIILRSVSVTPSLWVEIYVYVQVNIIYLSLLVFHIYVFTLNTYALNMRSLGTCSSVG